MAEFVDNSFYTKQVKIIRDLVHGYINLTKFELSLIDTIQFQRLKDVRQLTCQHVYPSARHTRFEHSLGVFELTKLALKHLNRNGMIQKEVEPSGSIISESLVFNAKIAALLHDVGHCPFSHLGEVEIDHKEVKNTLVELIKKINASRKYSVLIDELTSNSKGTGSKHEQLSCIVIIKKYYDVLSTVEWYSEDGTVVEVDFELIIRSILGMLYDTSNANSLEENRKKNVVVQLINSSIFDMDKLDYIMRDSFFTGIGTPSIDTQRLFRNMYFNNDYSLVFTSKAVPALQNMIDSRDELYMYVYNHHAVVFSDFLNAYILRKLDHNYNRFIKLLESEIDKNGYYAWQVRFLGLVPISTLFSVDSIVENNCSDSDWISLLNEIQYKASVKENMGEVLKDNKGETESSIPSEGIEELVDKIRITHELIYRYHKRSFLKPWWKTVFEFTHFMNQNFKDDAIRKKLGQMICGTLDGNFDSAEFRSQIAKHVIYITQKLENKLGKENFRRFEEGDFFIVQRSNRFLCLESIAKLDIALKSSEILGSPNEILYSAGDYFVKYLTNIIPQKDYSAIYAKEGFYVYSKKLEDEHSDKIKKKYYEEIERIFVFVASEFVRMGEVSFNDSFLTKDPTKEQESKNAFWTAYENRYY